MVKFDDPALEFWRKRCEFWHRARLDALKAAKIAEVNFWEDYRQLMAVVEQKLNTHEMDQTK